MISGFFSAKVSQDLGLGASSMERWLDEGVVATCGVQSSWPRQLGLTAIALGRTTHMISYFGFLNTRTSEAEFDDFVATLQRWLLAAPAA